MTSNPLALLPVEEQQLILQTAALTPPLGITSNFDNPPNKDTLAHAAIGVCTAVATISFIIRFYVRVINPRTFKFEDFLVLCGYAGHPPISQYAPNSDHGLIGVLRWLRLLRLQLDALIGILYPSMGHHVREIDRNSICEAHGQANASRQ
jgi:hypothetical protein